MRFGVRPSAPRSNIEAKYAAVGSAETVKLKFREILGETHADELIVTAQIFDHAARLRSFEIGADVAKEIVANQ